MPPICATSRPTGAARQDAAMDIVDAHTALCLGANFIPVPILDSVAVSAVQLKMIVALSRHYGADFEVERGRALVASLAAGCAQELVRRTPAAAAFKTWIVQIPVIGAPLRHLGWPALLAAYTYFLGKSYVDHYEAGGHFETFQPPGWLNPPVTRACHPLASAAR